MISLEIDFLFFLISLVLVFKCFRSVTLPEEKQLLLLYWVANLILTVLLLISLSRLGVNITGWKTKSLFRILTISNLVSFFTYNALEDRIFSFRRSVGFAITLVLYLFFGSFFYWIQIFQTGLHAEDKSLLLPFTISLGAFVWSREMFWTHPKTTESKLADDFLGQFGFLFLPSFLLLLSPFSSNYEFVEILSSAVILGLSSLLGFTLVSQILKVTYLSEAEIGMWIGTISFSSVLGIDLLLGLPIAFFVGMMGRGLYFLLDTLDWSSSGKRGVVSFLFPSVLGVFLPFLLLEPKDWSHAPYVLLGVQVLYFLSFYLISSLVFGILLLCKPKTD
ncbi:hypothetical protein EHQ59_08175 [Leptospira kemamanensis]|uniref:Uncharacterized protein n=1 Tax=Leptospira kemamanensis TaxID=2484942 RepID=A0A4R9JSP7_9LEPT|nr:hypothetical protein [Leptospira kemamanensis]TGL54158.1 hypothetical protein EHQ59_08175 [Leptospira kemamanensis]